jgi:tRNA (cmo5U34)-methyltransferase
VLDFEKDALLIKILRVAASYQSLLAQPNQPFALPLVGLKVGFPPENQPPRINGIGNPGESYLRYDSKVSFTRLLRFKKFQKNLYRASNSMNSENPHSQWDEELSRRYLDYGHYFVPARELQMHIMVDLVSGLPPPNLVLELCCGEGLLAEMLLEEIPGSTYLGMDGSELMLEKSLQRLSRFGGRVQLKSFDLEERSWRKLECAVQSVVSSLAIHHLDVVGKQQLFRDVYTMLIAGGIFIIADMVEPSNAAGRKVTADAWDEVVRQRSMEPDGSTDALDFFLREGWNTYRYLDPDDIDHPSPLFDQLRWLEQAGFVEIDVHFLHAGHALFSGWKKPDRTLTAVTE